MLWFCYARKFRKKAFLNIDTNQTDIKLPAKNAFYFIAFPFAEKTVIDKNASQIFTYSTMDQHGSNRRIDSAGQGTDYLFIANRLFQTVYCCIDKGLHFPVTGTPADVKKKIL